MKMTISIHLANLRYVDNLPKNTSIKKLISFYNTFLDGIKKIHFVTLYYNEKLTFLDNNSPNNNHF